MPGGGVAGMHRRATTRPGGRFRFGCARNFRGLPYTKLITLSRQCASARIAGWHVHKGAGKQMRACSACAPRV